jgi:hypothetical protein
MGTPVFGYAIERVGDLDLYRFTLTTAQTIEIRAAVIGGDLQQVLHLFDSQGFTRASGTDGILMSLGAGTYYVGISDVSNPSYDPIAGSGSGTASGGTGSYALLIRPSNPAVSVAGTRFEDGDADGVRDPGEPGLAGWLIWADADDDQRPDPGEPSTLTRAADPASGIAAGSYELTGLAPGRQLIRSLPQWEWQDTAAQAPPDPDALSPSQTLDSDVLASGAGLAGVKEILYTPDDLDLIAIGFSSEVPPTGAWLARFRRSPVTGDFSLAQRFQATNSALPNPVPGIPVVEGLQAPDAIAVNRDGTRIYVSSPMERTIAAFERDPASGALSFLTRSAALLEANEGTLEDLAISPDGRQLYALSYRVAGYSSIFALDADFMVVLEEAQPPVSRGFRFATHLSISPDGRDLYASSPTTGLVHYYRDPVDGRMSLANDLSANFALDVSSAWSPGGDLVAFTGPEFSVVQRRDPASGRLELVDNGGHAAHSAAFAGDATRLYLAAEDSVEVRERSAEGYFLQPTS